MKISTDVALDAFNTLALSARCDALVEVHDDTQLQNAISWAKDHGTPLTVLGQGSNIVLAGDVSGLVVLQRARGIDVLARDDQTVTLRVAAGQTWHALVASCLSNQWYGLENLALIPGTVGAAPIQNIGAYGVELESFVVAVHGVAIEDGKTVSLSGEECLFSYRDSIFKHGLRDQVVITAVDLRLSTTPQLKLDYPALAQALRERGCHSPTPQDVFDTVVAIRRSKLPNPVDVPNAGSFFKNPLLEKDRATSLQQEFPDLPVYPQADGRVKLPAAWLIDQTGWKGHRQQGVGVHPEHALVLVNYSGTDGSQLLALADQIVASVQQRFAVTLEMEPRVYGTRR